MENSQVRPRIAAYARISLDVDQEALGVARQHADVQAIADRRGWSLVSYTDNNVSAYQRGVVRPEFERMVADLESGQLDGVAAYDLDRLWRKPADLERMIDVFESHKRLMFATVQGEIDLGSPDGRMMARVMVAVANKSSSDTSRRVRRKIQEQAEQGQPHWSKRPYGYRMDGSLDPDESAIVRWIGDRFLKGYSYRELAWQLNESGKRTRTGQKWQVGTMRQFMRQERFAAIRRHQTALYDGSWSPIFTRGEWDRISREVRRRSESYEGTPNNRKYLLTGLLVCSCGTYLRGMTKRDGDGSRPLRRTYQCPTGSESERRLPSCASVCVGADPLEHFLREVICFRLDSPDFAEQLASSQVDDGRVAGLIAELDQLTERRRAIVDDFTDGTLSKADFVQASRRLDTRIKAINADVDRQKAGEVNLALQPGETIRDAWNNHPDGWRRQLIETLIESVTISKSSRKPFYEFNGRRTRFDRDRVSICWRV